MQLMRIRYIFLWGAMPFALLQTGFGQNFADLGFEQASLSPVPSGQYGGFVPIASALPGWIGYLGTNQVTQVLQNNYTLGSASIDILGPGWTNGIIQGRYTVVLQEGQDASQPFPVLINASISQVGLVPTTAKSIQLKESGSGDFTVSFAGQNLALIPLGVGTGVGINYTLYGADISMFAGQAGALTITELVSQGISPPDYFDSIVFSPQTVPEPSALSLFTICILLVCGWKKRPNQPRQPTPGARLSVFPMPVARRGRAQL